MTDEIQVWAIDGLAGSAAIARVEPTKRTETENLLEDVLVKAPDMLMPDLALVGRQTPIAGGYLDLLGVDKDGRLVVFELKRGKVTREAITQVLDYGSSLESMSTVELGKHIAERSGARGIEKIEDFDEWYSQRGGEQDSLKPVRMVLVGLDADENASRMVDFLAKRGLDIALLTFYGYEYDGKTLLARQVQRVVPITKPPVDPRQALAERARSLEIGDFWKEVNDSFEQLGSYIVTPRTDGFTFYLPPLKMPDLVKARQAEGSHSVRLDGNGKIRITFFPAAIHLCEAEFGEQQAVVPFRQEPPPNAPRTNRVSEQWYCLLDGQEWLAHKEVLTALASAVYVAWDEARRQANRT
jgi:hypothetical protein